MCAKLIENIENEMNYSCRDMSDILKIMKSRNDLGKLLFLQNIDTETAQYSLSALWETSVKKYQMSDCLTGEDADVLISFGKGLGVTDLEGQNNNCAFHRNLIKASIDKAKQNCSDRGKLWTSLSFLTGMGLIIIMY